MSMTSRIKEIRQRKSISFDALAEAAGLQLPVLFKIEDGQRVLDRSTAEAIGLALGVHPTELLTDPTSLGWWDIATAPAGDELFLAFAPDGRMIIVRGSILANMMKIGTPNHLQFPATHWMPLPSPPTPTNDTQSKTLARAV